MKPHTLPSSARWPDLLIGMVVILWMAEATARLPYQGAFVAAIYAAVLCRMLLTQSVLHSAVLAAIPALPLVALCLASTLWSPVPQVTLISGVQLAFTVLTGAWLGRLFRLHGLAVLLALALLAGTMGSALNLLGFSAPTHAAEGGFLGIFLNKNALGQRAALLTWTLVYLLATSRSNIARGAWLGGFLMTIWLLVLSASVSSWALSAVGCSAMIALGLRERGGLAWRMVLVTLTCVATAALASLVVLRVDPFTAVLDLAGKDATLTGRTLLWSIALEVSREAPLSGHGYMAFWADPANAQQVALIRLVFGPTVAVFHNFALETLVALGPAGVVALAVFVGACTLRLWRLPRGVERRWALVTLGAFLILSALGSSLFRPHEITMLLVSALLAAPGRAPRAELRGRHVRRRAYSGVWRPTTASQ